MAASKPTCLFNSIKDCYSPENIYYEGTDKLDALAEHVNLNPEQMQILYRLFGQN